MVITKSPVLGKMGSAGTKWAAGGIRYRGLGALLSPFRHLSLITSSSVAPRIGSTFHPAVVSCGVEVEVWPAPQAAPTQPGKYIVLARRGLLLLSEDRPEVF